MCECVCFESPMSVWLCGIHRFSILLPTAVKKPDFYSLCWYQFFSLKYMLATCGIGNVTKAAQSKEIDIVFMQLTNDDIYCYVNCLARSHSANNIHSKWNLPIVCYILKTFTALIAHILSLQRNHYSHIPNSSIDRNNSIGWKMTKS